MLNFIKKTFFTSLFIYLTLTPSYLICRSHLRKSHEKIPKIEVSREKITKKKHRKYKHRKLKKTKNKIKKIKDIAPKVYFIASNNLEAEPLFKTFDKDFFYKTILPEKITYRYDQTKSVTKEELDKKLENLVKEIRKRKRKYTDFKILKQSDFNRRKKSGLLILKFKDYPFVVKFFIESPKSLVKPYSKGVVPALIFNINGGLGRHFLGFTRIKNLHNIRKKILNDPKWSHRIEFPRKWHWIPKDPKNIRIIGKNFDRNDTMLETIIPGTYCIIADCIKLKNTTFSIFDKKAREECMSLCNFLNICIDPHIDNFLLEEGSDKIALIDTENFHSVVGLKGKQEFSGYVSWLYNVAFKALNDIFFRPKRRR